MPGDWTDRVIRAPAAENLSQEEFRSLFKLSEDAYDRYRASGVIPSPVAFSTRVMVHPWEHAVLFSFWMRFGDSRDAVKGKEGKV